MKIGYIAEFDTTDITKRSGLGVNIASALKQNSNTLQYLDKFNPKPPLSAYIKKVFYRLKKQRFDFLREKWYAKQFAQYISKEQDDDIDLFFSLSSQPIAFLKSDKPIVFYTDATFAQMIGFYFNNLSGDSIRNGTLIEKKALDNTNLAIYASKWAADSAINDYSINSAKIKVVPRGANIICDRSAEDIKQIVANRSKEIIKLLFVGVEWHRKGGDKAYEIVKYLNDNNIKAELHIVGLKSIPLDPLPDYIINHGFLNKSDSSQNEILNNLYLESHFFLLPTVADTFGIVFAEANSFGLPAISFNVGGIASVILSDVNGYCFDPNINTQDIALYVRDVFHDQKRYTALCNTSFNEYESRLNWRVSGALIQNLIKEL
ncbi:glycosyltransferase [Pedobacter sp. AW31-3R]|uniref:glycosyltransferase n=1 Tax=Pedobacter sp. AW31-3R TaxID=3445781 RepID=UPI003F9FB031